MRRKHWVRSSALVLSLALLGCSSSGGSTGTGGNNGSGGTSATGGSTTTGNTGGSTSTGGTTGTGGTSATGGSTGAGGVSATGGVSGTGGSLPGTGGTNNTGGSAGRGSGGTGVAGAAGGTSGGTGGSAGGTSGGSCPVISQFASWPSGKGPADVGKLAVTDFKTHTSDTYSGAGYALAFSWFGALRFTKTTGDTTNNAALITAFEPYASGQTTVDNSASATVDYRAFGTLPLEIYQQNMDMRDKTLGLARADAQWANTTSDGITTDARYWSDDMYMITGLQVDAFRATQSQMYLDRAAKTAIAYFAALQQSDGLMWHTKTSQAKWGRANGWFAAGMAELLVNLPAGSSRDTIMANFKKQLDGLVNVQVSGGADDGMWRQVLDLSSAPVESSCTAMFTFALTTALKNGWVTDPKYATAAQRGWNAVANKTNSAGKLSNVCPGTGAAPAGSLSSQQQFYDSITFGTGDLHGQAPLLWAANALLRTDCPGKQ